MSSTCDISLQNFMREENYQDAEEWLEGMHRFWRKGSGAIFRQNCARFNHFGGYLPRYSSKTALDVDVLLRLAHRLCYFWLFWAQAVMIFHQIEGRSMTSIEEIGTIPYRRWTTFRNNDLYLLLTFWNTAISNSVKDKATKTLLYHTGIRRNKLWQKWIFTVIGDVKPALLDWCW